MAQDAALNDAIAYAFSPAPPGIVEPFLHAGEGRDFERHMAKDIVTARERFDAWLEQGKAARAQMLETISLDNQPSRGVAERLSAAIVELEANLRDQSAELYARNRYLTRRWGRLAKMYPTLAPGIRLSMEAASRMAEEELRERSDFIMFIRSIAVGFDPDAYEVEEFESSGDLKSYLHALTA